MANSTDKYGVGGQVVGLGESAWGGSSPTPSQPTPVDFQMIDTGTKDSTGNIIFRDLISGNDVSAKNVDEAIKKLSQKEIVIISPSGEGVTEQQKQAETGIFYTEGNVIGEAVSPGIKEAISKIEQYREPNQTYEIINTPEGQKLALSKTPEQLQQEDMIRKGELIPVSAGVLAKIFNSSRLPDGTLIKAGSTYLIPPTIDVNGTPVNYVEAVSEYSKQQSEEVGKVIKKGMFELKPTIEKAKEIAGIIAFSPYSIDYLSSLLAGGKDPLDAVLENEARINKIQQTKGIKGKLLEAGGYSLETLTKNPIGIGLSTFAGVKLIGLGLEAIPIAQRLALTRLAATGDIDAVVTMSSNAINRIATGAFLGIGAVTMKERGETSYKAIKETGSWETALDNAIRTASEGIGIGAAILTGGTPLKTTGGKTLPKEIKGEFYWEQISGPGKIKSVTLRNPYEVDIQVQKLIDKGYMPEIYLKDGYAVIKWKEIPYLDYFTKKDFTNIIQKAAREGRITDAGDKWIVNQREGEYLRQLFISKKPTGLDVQQLEELNLAMRGQGYYTGKFPGFDIYEELGVKYPVKKVEPGKMKEVPIDIMKPDMTEAAITKRGESFMKYIEEIKPYKQQMKPIEEFWGKGANADNIVDIAMNKVMGKTVNVVAKKPIVKTQKDIIDKTMDEISNTMSNYYDRATYDKPVPSGGARINTGNVGRMQPNIEVPNVDDMIDAALYQKTGVKVKVPTGRSRRIAPIFAIPTDIDSMIDIATAEMNASLNSAMKIQPQTIKKSTRNVQNIAINPDTMVDNAMKQMNIQMEEVGIAVNQFLETPIKTTQVTTPIQVTTPTRITPPPPGKIIPINFPRVSLDGYTKKINTILREIDKKVGKVTDLL